MGVQGCRGVGVYGRVSGRDGTYVLTYILRGPFPDPM